MKEAALRDRYVVPAVPVVQRTCGGTRRVCNLVGNAITDDDCTDLHPTKNPNMFFFWSTLILRNYNLMQGAKN